MGVVVVVVVAVLTSHASRLSGIYLQQPECYRLIYAGRKDGDNGAMSDADVM